MLYGSILNIKTIFTLQLKVISIGKQEYLENYHCFRRMHIHFNGLLWLFAEICKKLFWFTKESIDFKLVCAESLLFTCLTKNQC
jgi:hypothetical protein